MTMIVSDILWHNESTNETQIWFMNEHQIARRATVLGEDGNAAFIGLPWSIVGTSDFNRDRNASVLWHNESTNETQIWFMDEQWVARRATVLGEDGNAAFVGLPWSIVGTSDFNGDGNADILWHNESTNETQIWFMNEHQIARRATVLGEDGNTAFVGLPWSIVGTSDFNRDGRVINPVSNFTFAADISVGNRNRLIARHRFALASVNACNNLSEQERGALRQAYQRRIHHTTLNQPGVNASATVGGSTINVNFGVLFPQGDREISQTLIHEMMHCAGFTHPDRRNPPAGRSCSAPDPNLFDCPNDNGQYYGTPPLRAEFCIAGSQSDVRSRLERKAAIENCVIDEEGVATIYTAGPLSVT
ncbi:MAG: hypothetical protein ACRDTH_26985 [Pseudonocardiaceae bacterium]